MTKTCIKIMIVML